MTHRSSTVLLCSLFLTPLPVCAQVVITEIMYDPEGADGKREWIEVRNEGSNPVQLSKWKITDTSNHVINAPPKNGGVGTDMLAPGSYAVLASDAATFLSNYPAVSPVFDTVLSLRNTSGTISIGSASSTLDTYTYTSGQGASNDGDSLQLSASGWIHAAPTPGAPNASTASIHTKPAPAAKPTTAKPPVKKSTSQIPGSDELGMSKSSSTEAVYSDMKQMVSAGTLGVDGSLGGGYWLLAAAALALGSGAAAAAITRAKRSEWDIVEDEHNTV